MVARPVVVARPEIHANDQKIGRHLLSLFSALSRQRWTAAARGLYRLTRAPSPRTIADPATTNAYGLGRRCKAGFCVAVGFRVRIARGGNADTISGSSLVFSARSIAVTSARGESESIGARKTRAASRLHTGHSDFRAAVPIGWLRSKSPSRSHRYAYVATLRIVRWPTHARTSNNAIGSFAPGSNWSPFSPRRAPVSPRCGGWCRRPSSCLRRPAPRR